MRIEHLEDLVALVERTVHPVGIVVGPRPVRHPRLVEQPAQVLPRLGLVAALELHELAAAHLDEIPHPPRVAHGDNGVPEAACAAKSAPRSTMPAAAAITSA